MAPTSCCCGQIGPTSPSGPRGSCCPSGPMVSYSPRDSFCPTGSSGLLLRILNPSVPFYCIKFYFIFSQFFVFYLLSSRATNSHTCGALMCSTKDSNLDFVSHSPSCIFHHPVNTLTYSNLPSLELQLRKLYEI